MLPLFDSPLADPPGRPGDGGAWFAAEVYAAAVKRAEQDDMPEGDDAC